MFTTRRLNAIAATALAGVLGTVGIVAAGSGPSERSVPAAAVATAVDAPTDDTAPITTTSDESDTDAVPHTAPAPTDVTPATTEQPAAPTDEITEPADEIDEPEAPGEPGEIEGDDVPDEPPPPPPPSGPSDFTAVPKPMPPLPPIPGPTDLVLVTDPVDPTPTPQGPGSFQVTPIPQHQGTITSGLTGCQLECVTSALLTANDHNANVGLAIETTVPVHVEIEVTKTGTDSSKFFNNPGYDTEWSTTLSPLQPDTTYDLTLIAIDQQGHSKVYEHQFTTVDIIDGLNANAQGCALHCLVDGSVSMTDSHSKVKVHVKTNTSAKLVVWVSTSEPGWVGDTPLMPAEAKVHHSENAATSWTFDVPGLQADTEYHIVVRAEDGWGVDHQIGTFRTDPKPPVDVRVAFEQIDVTYDGDSGALNRGELSFGWGFDGEAIGTRGEEKMHGGTRIELSNNNFWWFQLSEDEGLPNVMVRGTERDWDGKIEFCTAGEGISDGPVYSADCDTKSNTAQLGSGFTLAQIEALPLCGNFGIDAGDPAARCAAIGTPDAGGDYARFTVVISFRIT
jgi:hypothetical protein